MHRRTMMMRGDLDMLCVDGVNYSVQPDNEIWYTTTDNNKSDNAAVLNNYGGDKDIKILAHVFENGIWKVKADRPIQKIPESYIRYAPTIVSISLPKSVFHCGAWSMGLNRTAQYSPNLQTIILASVITSFNSGFAPFACGDLNIYVPRGKKGEFVATKILEKTPTNKVFEWGRVK